jgi:hypothetical protein
VTRRNSDALNAVQVAALSKAASDADGIVAQRDAWRATDNASYPHARTCQALSERGMMVRTGSFSWRITDKGRERLAQEQKKRG